MRFDDWHWSSAKGTVTRRFTCCRSRSIPSVSVTSVKGTGRTG